MIGWIVAGGLYVAGACMMIPELELESDPPRKVIDYLIVGFCVFGWPFLGIFSLLDYWIDV